MLVRLTLHILTLVVKLDVLLDRVILKENFMLTQGVPNEVHFVLVITCLKGYMFQWWQ